MRLIHGDCLEQMATLPTESVDSIVTDPPYGLSFMGKDWDHGVPGEAFWREALKVAKPGAHLLAFGGSRTYHRLACAIEDARWEIRDCIMWVYGSGFPKSHNLTGDWQGWGTALKPAYEPIIVARKPLVGTIAANVQQYGTGAINVDGCRVEGVAQSFGNPTSSVTGHLIGKKPTGTWAPKPGYGRWPANFIHDNSDEVMQRLGKAARFFYTAKASKRDRNEGCEGLEAKVKAMGNQAAAEIKRGNDRTVTVEKKNGMSLIKMRNHHPTVKPTDLMRYLCRLVTPPGGVVLDPFMGSGSTGKGATLEGFDFIGIEQNAEYLEIAKARIQYAIDQMSQKLFTSIR